ncbi:MAG: cupin domain-containing protein [Bacteroides sp.]|nr:cupin domain-containing protein [Bacteroides sp.]
MAQKSELENTGIKSEKLIETSAAWNGSALPDYPQATPVISIYKYTFPPHTVTNPHYHKIINCGVVLSGTLTIVCQDGSFHDFHAGESIVETIGTVHHGENRGDIDVEVIMFYAGDRTTPLSFPIENKSNK